MKRGLAIVADSEGLERFDSIRGYYTGYSWDVAAINIDYDTLNKRVAEGTIDRAVQLKEVQNDCYETILIPVSVCNEIYESILKIKRWQLALYEDCGHVCIERMKREGLMEGFEECVMYVSEVDAEYVKNYFVEVRQMLDR